MKKQQQVNGETKQDDQEKYVFRLYITGASPNSLRAVNNIRDICEKYIQGQYTLEIIDVYQQPAVAKQEQLIALPLLIKKHPLPERRLIGDLSDRQRVLNALMLNARQ